MTIEQSIKPIPKKKPRPKCWFEKKIGIRAYNNMWKSIFRNLAYLPRALIIGLFVIAVFVSWFYIKQSMEYEVKYIESEEAHLNYVAESEYALGMAKESVSEAEDIAQGLKELYQETAEYEEEIYTVTAYTADDEKQGTTNKTSIGFYLNRQYMDYINIFAVDPEVIPYGSMIIFEWEGKEIIGMAGDTGGKIKGYHIDICMTDRLREQLYPEQNLTNLAAARRFGVKDNVIHALPIRIVRND